MSALGRSKRFASCCRWDSGLLYMSLVAYLLLLSQAAAAQDPKLSSMFTDIPLLEQAASSTVKPSISRIGKYTISFYLVGHVIKWHGKGQRG